VKRGDVQQALLKPAFARLYPGIPTNEWYPVSVMLELVRTSRRHPGGTAPPAEPGLDAEHFTFRGTASAGSKEASREGRVDSRKPRRRK